ncbi:hypothetical protein ISN45_Aa07g001970 [Arabidopsis thaliana x Arabidopsis arenosa]|uniref:Uncharacterized protein n=1 Tax=Arabidopsis thaliana x Arabidopsis arenosa TaxID=1240361 RepID=A0A8T1Y3U5_9BRAS|nr:hypothetical protein ISN45_Aa07g001970 [Arabidopsis thaliana x Arabidopsis arenosa]
MLRRACRRLLKPKFVVTLRTISSSSSSSYIDSHICVILYDQSFSLESLRKHNAYHREMSSRVFDLVSRKRCLSLFNSGYQKIIGYRKPNLSIKFGQFRLPKDNWSICEQMCVGGLNSFRDT